MHCISIHCKTFVSTYNTVMYWGTGLPSCMMLDVVEKSVVLLGSYSYSLG